MLKKIANSYVTLVLHVSAKKGMSTAHCYGHELLCMSCNSMLSFVIRDCAMHLNAG